MKNIRKSFVFFEKSVPFLFTPCYDLIIMKRTVDRILIVENDPIICDMVARQALGSAGYEAIVVDNSSAAISKV